MPLKSTPPQGAPAASSINILAFQSSPLIGSSVQRFQPRWQYQYWNPHSPHKEWSNSFTAVGL